MDNDSLREFKNRELASCKLGERGWLGTCRERSREFGSPRTHPINYLKQPRLPVQFKGRPGVFVPASGSCLGHARRAVAWSPVVLLPPFTSTTAPVPSYLPWWSRPSLVPSSPSFPTPGEGHLPGRRWVQDGVMFRPFLTSRHWPMLTTLHVACKRPLNLSDTLYSVL